MSINDLITALPPTEKRALRLDGTHELHLFEGAVMVAFAAHLLELGASAIWLHPDGEHAKQVDFVAFLSRRGFAPIQSLGTTRYGGIYRDARQRTITIKPQSGKGDVTADIDGETYTAECKGGIINTRHSGQVSRLRKGLCEAVGLLMSTPCTGKQFAVVPYTPTTLSVSKSMIPRCALAGIRIALVTAEGGIVYPDIITP